MMKQRKNIRIEDKVEVILNSERNKEKISEYGHNFKK
jgi:hypothetical protein